MNVLFKDTLMSENAKITTGELRFIYKLILDGCSDSDILNKYKSLKESAGHILPTWIDESFIKNKRAEMEIAAEVLKDSFKEIIKKLIPKQKDHHFAQVAEISDMLLQNNLDTVTAIENSSRTTYGFRSKYAYSARYSIKDGINTPLHLNTLELIERFRKNVENACKRYSTDFFYNCYVPHIKATMGEEMEAEGGFWPTVERKPYEVIKTIKNIANGSDLKGTCPLCKMENQLSPFLKSSYNDIFQS